MCIIIDADVSHQFAEPSVDAVPVIRWLEQGPGKLVIGGKNTRELSRNTSVARWIRGLLQAGRARQVKTDRLELEERAVRESALCFSNDQHVIALARVSGARLAFSRDTNLHVDFTNPALLSKPRGKVYQNATHAHLLGKDVCP